MQHGDAVLDDGGLADHHAGAVVDEDALADHGAGMDVEAEQRAGAALQVVGERVAALAPQPVRGAVRLQRVVALEPQERVEMGGAGGIAVGHGHDVETSGETDSRIGGEGFLEDLADQGGGHLGGAGEAGQVVAQRALEARLAEDGGVQQAGQDGVGGGSRLGGLADIAPDRVDRAAFRWLGCAVHGALL